MTYTPNRAVSPVVRTLCLLTLGCVVAAPAVSARGAAAELPAAVRTATVPDEAAIDTQLKKTAALLTGETPADQSKGRDLIVAEVGPVGAGQPSPAFLFAYARAVNKALLSDQVAKNPNMRVRLNAAVAVAKVAEKAENKELATAIIAFLNDSHEAVALWGMKGTRFILKSSLAQGAGVPPIIPVMLATAKKFPSTTGAAYESLRVNEPTSVQLPTLIAASQDLIQQRLAAYKGGVPVDPAAELIVASTLSDGTWWRAHPNPASKTRTVQLLVDLGTLAGERVVQATGEAQDQLKFVVKQAASGVVAIAIHEKNAQGLRAQLSALDRINTRTPPADVARDSKLLFTAAKTVFPELKPLAGGGGAATTPGSTTSTAQGNGK